MYFETRLEPVQVDSYGVRTGFRPGVSPDPAAVEFDHREAQYGRLVRPPPNARQLQAALVRTVRNFSGLHHEGFGYGVLDVRALFDALR